VFLRTAEKVTSEAEKSEMRRTVKEAIVVVLFYTGCFALSLWSGRTTGFARWTRGLHPLRFFMHQV